MPKIALNQKVKDDKINFDEAYQNKQFELCYLMLGIEASSKIDVKGEDKIMPFPGSIFPAKPKSLADRGYDLLRALQQAPKDLNFESIKKQCVDFEKHILASDKNLIMFVVDYSDRILKKAKNPELASFLKPFLEELNNRASTLSYVPKKI